MSVVPFQPGPAAERPWVAVLQAGAELARAIADTEFVPKALRHKPAEIAAAVLYGDEVGLGPMMSLQKVKVIDGTPALAAIAQRALVLAAGHDLWLEEHTKTRVTWAGRRKGSAEVTRVTWSMDTAREAGLAGNRNYRTYPRQMLSARASAELCAAVFADVLAGLPAIEELEDGAVVSEATTVAGDAPPAAAPSRRRQRAAGGSLAAAAPRLVERLGPAPEVVDTTAEDGTGVVLERPAWQPAEPADVDKVMQAAAHQANPAVPAPEPEPEVVAITDAQLKRLQIAMREAGISDRADRLAFCCRTIGREITSSRQLSMDEASQVIDLLALLKPRTEPAARRRGRGQATAAEPTPDTPPSVASAPESDPPPGTSPDAAPSGGGSGFPHDLPDLQGGEQEALPLTAETDAAWRRALSAMPLVDRHRLEALMVELGYLRRQGDDPAPMLSHHWPLLVPSEEAAKLLLAQLEEMPR